MCSASKFRRPLAVSFGFFSSFGFLANLVNTIVVLIRGFSQTGRDCSAQAECYIWYLDGVALTSLILSTLELVLMVATALTFATPCFDEASSSSDDENAALGPSIKSLLLSRHLLWFLLSVFFLIGAFEGSPPTQLTSPVGPPSLAPVVEAAPVFQKPQNAYELWAMYIAANTIWLGRNLVLLWWAILLNQLRIYQPQEDEAGRLPVTGCFYVGTTFGVASIILDGIYYFFVIVVSFFAEKVTIPFVFSLFFVLTSAIYKLTIGQKLIAKMRDVRYDYIVEPPNQTPAVRVTTKSMFDFVYRHADPAAAAPPA